MKRSRINDIMAAADDMIRHYGFVLPPFAYWSPEEFKGRTDVVAFPDDARLMEQLDALNLMQAQNRVLDLPATRIDARHSKYIALQPMAGAPETTSPGGT